jgi:probable HAF family extracellular repeat protein
MACSFLSARTTSISAAVFAIIASAIAGCGGSTPLGPSMQTPSSSQPAGRVDPAGSSSWTYSTLDNPANPSFNELLGINNVGKVCGYDGNLGSASQPARGYCSQDYGAGNFRHENYPGAVDTVVTSVNSARAIAGYYVTTQGLIFGFIYTHGIWTSYKDPKLRQGTSNITELLGLNQAGLAVGFYTDEHGTNHGFELNEVTGKFHGVTPPGGASVEATGINGKGDIVGWMTTSGGSTKSFLLKGGSYTVYSYPKAAVTEALAVNWQDQLVGSYQDGGSKTTHAFVLSTPLTSPQWQSIDEPKASGVSVLTSIEDHDYMVGYYIDSNGVTNGFLATPVK